MITRRIVPGMMLVFALVSACGNGDSCSSVTPKLSLTIYSGGSFDARLAVYFANGASTSYQDSNGLGQSPTTLTLDYPRDAVTGPAHATFGESGPGLKEWFGEADFFVDLSKCSKVEIVAYDVGDAGP